MRYFDRLSRRWIDDPCPDMHDYPMSDTFVSGLAAQGEDVTDYVPDYYEKRIFTEMPAPGETVTTVSAPEDPLWVAATTKKKPPEPVKAEIKPIAKKDTKAFGIEV